MWVYGGGRKQQEATTMTLTQRRPEFDATNRSVRLEGNALVDELVDILGAKLVAYIASVSETRAVREWASGDRRPRPDTDHRLRFAYVVASLIAAEESPRIAQTWLMGLNPQLDDQSPARLIREGDIHEVRPRIIAAARAFVSS
jgi:hypothetical protein